MDFQRELIAEFDRETASTRRMLEAIPDGVDFGWKPQEKSMTFGKLAGHVADTCGDWAVHALTVDKLEWTPEMNSAPPSSKTQVLEGFDKNVKAAKEALAGMSADKWENNWKFVAQGQTWIDDTKYNVWRTWVINHMIHHRGQLSVYLRLQGAKLPGMYGPSADEM